jgi:endonuclease/exonuclease/phosphatase family metal-dependent hydrolase
VNDSPSLLPSIQKKPLPQLRIGTAHFESLPEDKPFRTAQFKISRTALTQDTHTSALSLPESSLSVRPQFRRGAEEEDKDTAEPALAGPIPHAVLVGDTNVFSLSELGPLVQEPFRFADAYAAAVVKSGADDRTWGLTFPSRFEARKFDYVLFRPGDPSESETPSFLKPYEARLLGNDPIPEKTSLFGRDHQLFPSDHLGVLVRFVWT